MRRIKNIFLLFFILLSLCLNLSCELTNNQSPGRIILIGVGLDYLNEDDEVNPDINGNAGLENPPNDIREVAYTLSILASESGKNFLFIPFIQQIGITTPDQNYPNDDNLELLFDNLKDRENISANVYDGDFDREEFNLTSEYSTFGNKITNFEPLSENDIVIFYYSGHGNEYSNGDLRLPKEKNEQDRESVKLSWLYDKLTSLDSKILAVLDSCGSGSFISESSTTINSVTTSFVDTGPALFEQYFNYESDNIVRDNLYVLSSTKAGKLSFDTRTLGVNHPNSIFSYYFLRSLGYENESETEIGTVTDNIPSLVNGKITIDNIYGYIKDNISRQEPLIEGNRKSLVLFNIN